MASAWDSTPGAAAPMPAAAVGASAPAGAPVSAWDATSAPQAAPPRGFLDSLGDMGSAFVHHVAAPLHGAAQFVENSIAAGANKLPDNAVSRYINQTAQSDNAALARWEKDYQASTPNGWGASTGAVAGSVAPFLLSGGSLQALGDAAAARVVPTAAGAAPSVLAKMASGAVQGGVVGAAQPVTNAPTGPTTLSDLIVQQPQQPFDYWGQKGRQVETGAVFGGLMPALGAAAQGAWNSGKQAVMNSPILNPSGYAARQVGIQLGADAPTVAGDLANAPSYVPGSVPTAAQAGANPRLVMMEKALANNSPDFKAALAARENANNAARLQAVGSVAQTPQALQAAIEQRAAVTGPMRDFAVTNGNPVPVGGVNSALSSLANGSLGVRPTIGGAASGMRSAVDDFTTVTPPNTITNMPGSATAHPAMLDALRQNANDYLSKFAPSGFVGTQEQAAMTPVKGAIIDAIDAANPGHKLSAGGWGQGFAQQGPTAPSYRDYLAEFAKRSVPINTMQVGQDLQDTLNGKAFNSSGDPMATLTNYQSALAKALRGSDYGIDPAAQAQLEGVGSDLQRATISNSVRAPGSDTAYNAGAGKTFLRAMGAADGSNVPAALAGGVAGLATGSPTAGIGAAMAAKKAGGFVTDRVSSALGDLMLDPNKLAAALQQQAQPAAAAAPSSLARLTGKLTPSMAAAMAIQLQQQQAPQVVAPAGQQAYAQ